MPPEMTVDGAIAWRSYLVLTLSIGLVGLGLGILPPLTAMVLTEHGYGSAVIGLQVACPAVGSILGALLSSRIHHLLSLRGSLITAALLAAAVTFPNDFTDNLVLWGALRLLFGMSMGLLFTASEAAVNQMVGESVRGRMIAVYTTSFTLFQLMGPTLVAAMHLNHSYPFSLAALLLLFPVPLLLLLTPQQAPATTEEEEGASWSSVWPQMPAIVFGTAFFSAFDVLILAMLPLFGLSHGLSPAASLLLASVVLVGDATLQIPLGWLADHLGRARVHAGCGVSVALLLMSLPLLIDTVLCWPVLYLLGGVAGAIYTLSMVACGERFSGRALVAASGVISATWGIASCLGPLAAGAMMQWWRPDALPLVLLCAVAIFLFSLWREARTGLHLK